jgi:hypothetical protein
LLTQLGEMRREGDITDDEYRSIKGRLIDQLEGPPRSPRTPWVRAMADSLPVRLGDGGRTATWNPALTTGQVLSLTWDGHLGGVPAPPGRYSSG